MPQVLAFFGSFSGIEDLAPPSEDNLKELISLRHGRTYDPNDFFRSCQTAKRAFQEFFNKDKEMHLYYVGHGREDGQLVFADGPLYLQNCLPPGIHRPQKLHLHLYMCYQHKAIEKMKEFLGTGGRNIYSGLVLAEVEFLTQDENAEISEKIFNYNFNKGNEGIRTQTTWGRPEFGHFNLYVHLKREKLRQAQIKAN